MSSKHFSTQKSEKPYTGITIHSVKDCTHKIADVPIHHVPANAYERKNKIRIHENNKIRRIIIPSKTPTEKPVILPKREYIRLKEESKFISQNEKWKIQKEIEEKKIEKSIECEARKDLLREIAANQQKMNDKALGKHESEAKRKNMYLLERAFELKHEQEEEVKMANRLILAAKCSAIRNAQMAEKELIKRETEMEEQRLNEMMEQERQKQLRMADEQNKLEEEKRKKFIKEMDQQNHENELRKQMELESIQEENRRMNLALIGMQQEQEEQSRKRREQCQKNADELRKVNEEMEHYKLMEREESRIADMKIAEYMRKKIQSDETKEKEIMEQKKLKEMELLRQHAILQKQNDLKAQMDELQAMRIQEEHEREWRDKEMKKALLQKQKDEELKRARVQQIEDLRRLQAMEIARDEQEHAKAIASQQENYNKQKNEKEKRKHVNADFREAILKQITEKERERIRERREKFEEGEAMRLENEIQQRYVTSILQRKLENLENTGLPDKYIKEITRKLKL